MRKYSTPEIELEVFKTSDVITVSTASLLTWENDGVGNSISWDNNEWWQTIS